MLTVAPRLACNDVSRRWGGGGALGQAFAEIDVCKRHKGAKLESMEIWKKGQDKGNRVVVFVQVEQPLFDSSPQWLFMKELE